MSTRISPEAYYGTTEASKGADNTQPIVNNYYTQPAQTQSMALPEEEIAQLKNLIIGLAIGLALGIAIYTMMRDTKCR